MKKIVFAILTVSLIATCIYLQRFCLAAGFVLCLASILFILEMENRLSTSCNTWLWVIVVGFFLVNVIDLSIGIEPVKTKDGRTLLVRSFRQKKLGKGIGNIKTMTLTLGYRSHGFSYTPDKMKVNFLEDSGNVTTAFTHNSIIVRGNKLSVDTINVEHGPINILCYEENGRKRRVDLRGYDVDSVGFKVQIYNEFEYAVQ